MNCAECKENLVAYAEGLLPESKTQAVESHLQGCPACRAELKHISALRDRLTANGKASARIDLENAVLDRILREQSLRLNKTKKTDRQLQLWRKIMKSKITKLAAAAVIIAVSAMSITYLGTFTSPAYAIEQTIKANHSVRYIYVKAFTAGEDEPKEFWVQCDELGAVKCARLHIPEWASQGDGAKVVVWKDNKAEVWLKRKNLFLKVRDKTAADRMLEFVDECDPKLAVERLYAQQEQGAVKIDIEQPDLKTEPIAVTATYLADSPKPGCRSVLFVDQGTKLVTAIKFYQLQEGEYRYLGSQEYYDYNQAIDPEMFSLEDEIPADVTRIDQVALEVGLPQGSLGDEEIAVEVVRQFFAALIAENYTEAGRLLEGFPADKLEQGLGHIKFLRVVSIGPVTPHPIPETRGVLVPCTVEIEKNGQVSYWKLEQLGVRQVHGQPGRWTIFGGI